MDDPTLLNEDREDMGRTRAAVRGIAEKTSSAPQLDNCILICPRSGV
jgi:hypothetical protein